MTAPLDAGSFIDTDRFCKKYFNEDVIKGYSLKEYSFFLGYYVHLPTDIRWSGTIYASLKKEYPREYAMDKHKLVQAAKEDRYDLDFLYLAQHPNFKAFSVFEKAVGFENEYMDMFSRDAFDNRRQYICGFYHSDEHGDLHREYCFLTPEQAESFVRDTEEWIMEQVHRFKMTLRL